MLQLIAGRAGSGKTHYIQSLLRDRLAAGETAKKDILIVPEQGSFEAERGYLAAVGNGLGRVCEVWSTRRLARRVFSLCGGAAGIYADRGACELLMNLALRRCEAELSFFRGAAHKPEFVDELLDFQAEAKSYRVSPQMLAQGAERVTDELTRQKTQELSMLMGTYEELLSNSYRDGRDDVTRLCETLRSCDYALGRTFNFDGFSGFTPQEMKLIETLLRLGCTVRIALTLPEPGENRDDLFYMTLRTKEALLACARRAGVVMETVVLTEQHRLNKELAHLERNLFAPNPVVLPGESRSISLHESTDPFSQAEYAANVIGTLVQDKGYRYRDILVLCRDLQQNSSVLRAVFSRVGIPFHLDEQEDILQKPVLLLVLSALQLACTGYTHEMLFRYLKCGLCGFTMEQIDALENYAVRWSLRDSAWKQKFVFHPEGIAQPMDEAAAGLLAQLNELRCSIITPLEGLKKGLQNHADVTGKCEAFYEFLCKIDLPSCIEARAEAARERGELGLSDQYTQLWQIVIGAMEQLCTVCGDQETSMKEFADLFELLLSGYEVATVPSALDEVLVASPERVRPHETKATILLSFNEGVFPQAQTKEGLLGDDQKQKLKEAGVVLSVGAELRAYEELFVVYTALFASSEKLILCTTRADSSGEEQFCSYLGEQIAHCFGTLHKTEQEDLTLGDLARFPEKGLEFAARALRTGETGQASKELIRYFEQEPRFSAAWKRLLLGAYYRNEPSVADRSVIQQTLGERVSASASRVERYRACRYSYFVEYLLGAKARKPIRFSNAEMGTFLHAVLERLLKENKDRGTSIGETDEKALRAAIRRIARDVLRDSFGEIDPTNKRMSYLFYKLTRALYAIADQLKAEFSGSAFEPLEFELSIGGAGEQIRSLEIRSEGGPTVCIHGMVDRLDGYEQDGRFYVRVVDYKSYDKTLDFTDVANGLSLQMLLYLSAVCENGANYFGRSPEGAGVLYLHMHQPLAMLTPDAGEAEVTAQVRKAFRMSGLVLGDAAVLSAMQRDEENQALFLPVRISKDGVATGQSVVSRSQMQKLFDHAKRSVGAMALELAQGRIDIDPYEKKDKTTPCQWCEFHEACLFDRSGGYNRYRPLQPCSKDQLLGEEGAHNGDDTMDK